MLKAAIGVDIGGTKINAGLVDGTGRILTETSLPTEASRRRVMEQARMAIDMVLAQAGRLAESVETVGIGVGTAGQVSPEDGSIVFATDTMPGYTGTPVRKILEDAYRLPVHVDNDVNVLAVAEKRLGSGRGVKDFVCVALGTGVGGAIVSNGRLLHGSKGAAGEIGHLSVRYDGPRCICGGIGCLELYASGTGIARLMRERLLLERPGTGTETADITAREVAELWLQGDESASWVMNQAVCALAVGLAGVIHTLNPEIIMVGGGVADIREPFFRRLREETERRTMGSMLAATRIEPAVMGSRSGMIGAALQVWEYGEELE